MDNSYPYLATMTRESFLFYEMRTTAQLLSQSLSDEKIIEKIVVDNLFQYPTEKSLARMARVCIKRLRNIENEKLIIGIARQPIEVAKQICLYAMMKDSRLLWEFMITVIAEKYRLREGNFSKLDINSYFMRLQEQSDRVASWSDSTIKELKRVILKTLVTTGYLDNPDSNQLNKVLLSPILENAIRENKDYNILPVFNCFD